ncbi:MULTISPECIES: peptidoglycan DD-metalloendopeptidase family protein [unclassified Nostoc]|uniref:peptidoglycan DD-metalloendopeptidase family protein n=1 Tax=unclassified Nostoc TaxID=2593658 RepID=UPI002AD2992E|nr:peptidoglycan DD-metalloendopeptidase family protein [Nostoc sp. DedQUE03]MDZ7971494.1 peptidoglycan DD-metalloendopeptidase family protein [Nostoc sp. DedQUE03]MDZ8046488.1 peptidoglycan DD-metalloendopeptidase family protein [Nostoc sp. DedQUE02]
MKRALKKRVKAVLNNNPSSDEAPVELLNVMNPKVNRRVRTKAAMIGLAISMGATSLLVTRQSDQAQAAVPVGSQKATSAIPAVPDTEVKFASTKLESQAVSSASVPENPVIVEPTAVSQVPGLEAKWQVAASGTSLQVPASNTFSQATAIYKNSNYLKPQVAQGLNNTLAETSFPTVNNLSDHSADGVGSTNASLTAQPQTVATSTAANSEINAQLKAQQEFALNRLQEKSNRLRKSLAQLQSGETKNLSEADIELAQPTTVVEKTALAQSNTSDDASKANLISKLKEKTQASAFVPVPVPATPTVIASSTLTAYEVKPGDTLAAIASRHNTSVSELVKANNLNNPNELQISQKLVIPAVQAETTVANKPTFVESSKTPKEAISPLNIGNANSYLPSSQSPTIAENTSITVPKPVTVQVQANSAADLETAPPTNKKYYGVGGDIAVPQAFAEMQQPKTPTNRVARVNNNNDRLRGLQTEIQRLQQKYRAQQSGNLVVPAAAIEANNAAMLTPISTPNNFTVPNPASRPNSVAIPIPVPTPIGSNYSVQPIKPQFRATVRPSEPVNPEFLPNLGSASQWTPSGTQSATRVATPSVRVNASDSLGKMRGTTVSPQTMPPLAAVDQYLPKPIDELTPPPSTSTLAYIWPTKGTLTSGFGMRWGRPHKGIDIANSTGTPVVASADGTIEKAGWNNGGYGNLVEIHHPDGSSTRYAHNSKILVQPGQQVHQGEIIALMGTTGHSTGTHCHFEVHPPGKGAVNPIAFLPQRL